MTWIARYKESDPDYHKKSLLIEEELIDRYGQAPYDKKTAAFHEAGHAVFMWAGDGDLVVNEIEIYPLREGVDVWFGGVKFQEFMSRDEEISDPLFMLLEAGSSIAGLVAEEMVNRDHPTTAGSGEAIELFLYVQEVAETEADQDRIEEGMQALVKNVILSNAKAFYWIAHRLEDHNKLTRAELWEVQHYIVDCRKMVRKGIKKLLKGGMIKEL